MCVRVCLYVLWLLIRHETFCKLCTYINGIELFDSCTKVEQRKLLFPSHFTDASYRLFCFFGSTNFTDFSIWGTNGSAIDVFLKKSQIDEVGQRLNEANIQYNIVVEDYQKEIEQENPPQEEIELLQNRNGMFIKLHSGECRL